MTETNGNTFPVRVYTISSADEHGMYHNENANNSVLRIVIQCRIKLLTNFCSPERISLKNKKTPVINDRGAVFHLGYMNNFTTRKYS